MAANVQVGGIFSLLDSLVMNPRFPDRFLLCPDIFAESAIAGFVFTADALDILIDHGKFGVSREELFFGKSACIGAPHSCPDKLRPFLWQAGATRAQACPPHVQIRRGRLGRLER